MKKGTEENSSSSSFAQSSQQREQHQEQIREYRKMAPPPLSLYSYYVENPLFTLQDSADENKESSMISTTSAERRTSCIHSSSIATSSILHHYHPHLTTISPPTISPPTTTAASSNSDGRRLSSILTHDTNNIHVHIDGEEEKVNNEDFVHFDCRNDVDLEHDQDDDNDYSDADLEGIPRNVFIIERIDRILGTTINNNNNTETTLSALQREEELPFTVHKNILVSFFIRLYSNLRYHYTIHRDTHNNDTNTKSEKRKRKSRSRGSHSRSRYKYYNRYKRKCPKIICCHNNHFGAIIKLSILFIAFIFIYHFIILRVKQKQLEQNSYEIKDDIQFNDDDNNHLQYIEDESKPGYDDWVGETPTSYGNQSDLGS